jgi:hypothetical protein
MRIVVFLFIGFFVLACSNEKIREAPAPENEQMRENIEKVYVSSAEILPGITAGNEVSVRITGNLPNPAYKIDSYDIKVQGNNIEITPLAYHDKSVVAIQMLVHFEDTVKVKLQELGTHTMKINGRTKTMTKDVVLNK